jgi:hypothetical protein
VDTSRPRAAGPVNQSLAGELKTIPRHPAAVAWEKLSPKRPLW